MTDQTFAAKAKRKALKEHYAVKAEKRAQHTVNPEDAERVEQYAMIGLDVVTIAHLIECNPETITLNYKQSLEAGRANAHQQIATRIWDLAMNGDRTMLIFYAKTRMRWSERVEVSGTDGNAIQITVDRPDKRLSREEWLNEYNKTIDITPEKIN